MQGVRAVSKPAPYPPDTRAKGWRFELDYEQIEQSDTWDLAGLEGRPWLLMLWLTAWRQVPCGSMPADEQVIAAKIGMPPKAWAKHRATLMRGWWKADDGRMYHPTLAARVEEMMKRRRSDSDRQHAKRLREAAEAAAEAAASPASHTDVTPVSRVTPPGVTPESSTDNRQPNTEEPKTKTPRKRAAPAVLVSVDDMVSEGVDRQHATDWLLNRKTKGLAPLTPSIWGETKGEASKAGLSVAAAIKAAAGEGWGGFKAKWMQPDGRNGSHVGQPASVFDGAH